MTHHLIVDMQARIEVAKKSAGELAGENRHGLTVSVIGDYTLVDDAADKWIVESEKYNDAVDTIIGEILAEEFDPIDEDGLDTLSYERLCCLTGCLYSRIGTNNDIGKLLESIQSSESDMHAICDWLQVTEEPQVAIALQLLQAGSMFAGNNVAEISSDWIETDLDVDAIAGWIAIGVWNPATAAAFTEAECTPDEISSADADLIDADDDDNSQYTDGSPIYATCNCDLDPAELIGVAKRQREAKSI